MSWLIQCLRVSQYFFLDALIKYSNQSNLKEKGFILPHNSRLRSMVGKSRSWVLKEAGYIESIIGDARIMNGCILPIFAYTSRILCPGNVLPTVKMSFPMSSKITSNPSQECSEAHLLSEIRFYYIGN